MKFKFPKLITLLISTSLLFVGCNKPSSNTANINNKDVYTIINLLHKI